MICRKRVAYSLLTLFLASVSALPAQEVPPRVCVLDSKPTAVSAVSLETGQVLATVPVEGKPWGMIISPDGRRVIVLDKEKGKQTVRFGYHPKAKSISTIIDTATMKVVASTELGWSVSTGTVWDRQGFGGSWIFSQDARYLTIACFGYRSQKPKETLPAELVKLDLQTGDVVSRFRAERPIEAMITTRDASLAVVYAARREGKKNQPTLSESPTFTTGAQARFHNRRQNAYPKFTKRTRGNMAEPLTPPKRRVTPAPIPRYQFLLAPINHV